MLVNILHQPSSSCNLAVFQADLLLLPKECELPQLILCSINNADRETSLKLDRLDRQNNRLNRKVKAFVNQKYEYVP